MCGRYSSELKWDDIAKLYDLALQGPPHWNFPPSYNICPTDPVDVVVPNFDQRQFKVMRWGIIPRWWMKPKKEWKSATFNSNRAPADDPTLIEKVELGSPEAKQTNVVELQKRLL
jgi:putative SOS response-associated peptidase YedK